MTRMSVKDFIISGSQEARDRFDEYLARMEEFLTRAKTEITDPERLQQLAAIDAAFREYHDAFEKVCGFCGKIAETC